MDIKKIILIVLAFLPFNYASLAQNTKFEALHKVLSKIPDAEMPKNKAGIDSLFLSAKTPLEINEALYYQSIYFKMVANYDTAEVLLKKTIFSYKKLKNSPKLARSYKFLGIINYSFINDFIKGRAYLDSAITTYQIAQNQSQVLECQRHISTLLYFNGNIKSSNKILVELATKHPKGTKEYLDIQDLLVNNHIADNNMEAAYQISKHLPAMYLKIKHKRRYVYSLLILGHLQKKMNKLKESEQNLLLSYKLSVQNNYSENLVDNTRYLGLLYTENGDKENANKFLFEALKASKAIKDKYSEMHALSSIGRYYTSINEFKLGDYYSNESARLNDSLFSEDNNKKLAEYEIKYKTAQKEKQLSLIKLDNEKKQKYIIGLAIGLISLLGFGYLYWTIRNQKQKEKVQFLELENQRKILNAKEIERQRIAKELHDSVGSQLTVVSTSLDNAYFLAENAKLLPQNLENINIEVRTAAQSLRDTIWATHNASISMQNLDARITHFIGKTLENTSNLKIEINKDILPEIQLNSMQALNIFRIIQEALQNILKHASAQNILYKISFEKDSVLIITLKDDGKGFAENELIVHENFGISNMKHRAAEIGANFQLNSQIGKGTELILQVPIAVG